MRAWYRGSVVVALVAIVAPACEWSSDTSSGVTSIIRIEGGQAYQGSISDPPTTIPTANASVVPQNAAIFPGSSNKVISGVVDSNANAVAIGVAGDTVYWRVPALSRDNTAIDSFDYTARLSISRDAATSPLLQLNDKGEWTLPLSARAVDNAGNFGPAEIRPLILDSNAIAGTLTVSLQWDTPTDLDLHVLVPANNTAGYVEVWTKHRSADPGDPTAGTSADGTLDFDSNANCQIDGQDLENVIWNGPPPAGHYVVRVAAASLCGLTSAAWYAYASVPGASKGAASGVFTDAATRSSAEAGSGVTAFEFDYP
jgi:hypothetical protein